MIVVVVVAMIWEYNLLGVQFNCNVYNENPPDTLYKNQTRSLDKQRAPSNPPTFPGQHSSSTIPPTNEYYYVHEIYDWPSPLNLIRHDTIDM